MNLKKVRNFTIGLIIFLFISTVVMFFLREFIANYVIKSNLDSISAPGPESRLLVFSPHNDDEILGPGELIKKTLRNGGKVKVVFMTNGDGYKNAIEFDYLNLNPKPRDFVKFGYTRQKESIRALKIMGLSEKDIIFLGYPDGGISNLWNTNWDKNDPYTSRYTQTDKSIYANSFTKDALYTGENVVSDLTKIIMDFKPTHIVFPHPNDRHPDHWATNAFVKYVLAVNGYTPEKEWLYLVHRGDWPTPMKKDTKMYLVPPAKLASTGTRWCALNLTPGDIDEKSKAIHVYKSQMRTLRLLMTAFERKNELFGEYDDAKLIQNERSDGNIEPDNRNLVVIDPLQDALRLEISKGADIVGLYAEISSDNNLHIFLRMDSKVEKSVKYNINMFFINGNKVGRLNLQFRGQKFIADKVSSQSITDRKGVRFSVEGSAIHAVIPLRVTGEFNNMLINANSSIEDHLIDKTAWRMLDR